MARLESFPSISAAVMGQAQAAKVKPNKPSPTKSKPNKTEETTPAFRRKMLNRMECRATSQSQRIRGMLAGDNIPRLDLPTLEVDFLPWSNFYGEHYGMVGCGPALLGQITHTNPFEIRTLLKPLIKKYWPTAMTGRAAGGTPGELMQLYLKLFDISMIPYTRADLCPKLGTMLKPITRKHVVLHESHVAKNTTSWIVYFGGHSYHNMAKDETNELDIINFPPDNTYLLYSPSWKFQFSGFLDFDLIKDEEALS